MSRKGVEPDCCYYVENAPRIIGKRKIDLDSDPPPDIVVEIDITSSSLKKFPIYAALMVPEIWRYDGQKAEIYNLTKSDYVEVSSSRFLPGLTNLLLGEFIAMSRLEGHTPARQALRRRVQFLQSTANFGVRPRET